MPRRGCALAGLIRPVPHGSCGMRIIVTRPEPECTQWVQTLASMGLEAVALPLIHIGPATDANAVLRCWERLGDYDAVMFVSGAAVGHFFSGRPAGGGSTFSSAGAVTPRFWAPGPGTVAALVRQGVDPALVDAPPGDSAQFDSEALWRVVGERGHRGHKPCRDRARRGWRGGRCARCDQQGAWRRARMACRGVGRRWRRGTGGAGIRTMPTAMERSGTCTGAIRGARWFGLVVHQFTGSGASGGLPS